MKKVYIFDLDGTLLNSMPYWAKAMISLLDKYNINYPIDVIKTIIPLGMKGTVEYFKTLGLNLTLEEFMNEVYSSLQVYYENEIKFKNGAFEYLKKLKKNGASLNILTASPKIFIEVSFKRLGAFELFDNLWSCDDFGLGKTEPEIFYKILDLLGAKTEEAIFFDDNIGSIKGSKKAGICSVAVFDPTNIDSREELINNADFHIEDFENILDKELF